jgi:hypothetical protein
VHSHLARGVPGRRAGARACDDTRQLTASTRRDGLPQALG